MSADLAISLIVFGVALAFGGLVIAWCISELRQMKHEEAAREARGAHMAAIVRDVEEVERRLR